MKFEIVHHRKVEKNTLRGFITVKFFDLPIEIRDIAIHTKDGQSWLQLPCKPYQKPDGTTAWSFIIKFHDNEIWREVQKEILKKL